MSCCSRLCWASVIKKKSDRCVSLVANKEVHTQTHAHMPSNPHVSVERGGCKKAGVFLLCHCQGPMVVWHSPAWRIHNRNSWITLMYRLKRQSPCLCCIASVCNILLQFSTAFPTSSLITNTIILIKLQSGNNTHTLNSWHQEARWHCM